MHFKVGGKYSEFREQNFISGKTEYNMHQIYRAGKAERKIKLYVANIAT